MHLIRLRSAWEKRGDSSAGKAWFERSFGRPTNLTGERVLLAVSPAPAGEVRLNDQRLAMPEADGGTSRCEIHQALKDRNLLAIESDAAMFDHEVWLEIVE